MRNLFFSILLMLLMPMVAGAQEPYAVLSGDNTVLTFYYDNQKANRNGMDVGPFSAYPDDYYPSWYGQRESITSVVFDDSFAGCTTLTSTAYWFYRLHNLSSITGISNLKTDNVTDMNHMFYGCRSLTSLDVTGFNTENVTDMWSMFEGCSGLTSLDLSGFNTDNVTNMYCMFYDCWRLTSLDLSGFKTGHVENMGYMFYDCSSLTSLDVSGFKTDKVLEMGYMFCNCHRLTSLDLTGFKTDKVMNMYGMFSGCSGLTNLDLSGFKTDKVLDMKEMFDNCFGLTTIYVGEGWSTAKVVRSYYMFRNCTSLVGGAGTPFDADHIDHTYAHIDGGSDNPGYFTAKAAGVPEPYAVLSNNNSVLTFYYDDRKANRNGMDVGPFTCTWDDDRESYTISSGWYEHRESITSVVFDDSFAGCTTLTSTAYWFCELENLTAITGISNLKTDNVTDMTYMFFGCSSLTSLDVSGFKTDNVIIMDEMFAGCSGLTSLDLSSFKTDNVTYMTGMFYYCWGLTSLDVSGFKTDNVAYMDYMFADCYSLTTIYAGNGWSTAKVQDGSGMFVGSTNLVGGAGTPYNANHTDHSYARIDGGSNNPGYFTAKEWPKGDLTHDGKVDASDVVRLVNLIMYPRSGNLYEGDVNYDGMVDASDVVWLTNLILKQ